jgi:tetratricopeptide (TPR) repeat protein
MLLPTQSKAFGILLSAGACALMLLTNCGCTQVKAEELEIQGVEFMKQHEWAKAIETFTAAIKLNPDHVSSYLRRGNSYLALKQNDQALEDFDKAISFKDDSDEHKSFAYQDRGVLYLNIGKFKEGIDDETNAINLKPRPENYSVRGRCKRGLKDYHGALSDYEEALKLDPDNYVALVDASVALIELKDYKGAIKDLTHTLELNVDDPKKEQAYVQRAVAKFDSHDFKGAIDDDEKALQLNSNDSQALQDRGNAKLALGEKAAAEKDFAAAKKATYRYDHNQAHVILHPEY